MLYPQSLCVKYLYHSVFSLQQFLPLSRKPATAVPFYYLFSHLFLFRHNQRSLEVKKDLFHKNRCHVRFPEVFSSFPYKVNVTAINALGKASATKTFEESTIGKTCSVLCFVVSVTFSFPVPSLRCILKHSWSRVCWPNVTQNELQAFCCSYTERKQLCFLIKFCSQLEGSIKPWIQRV